MILYTNEDEKDVFWCMEQNMLVEGVYLTERGIVNI